MSSSQPIPAEPGTVVGQPPDAPDSAGKFSLTEDWLAVIVGLTLLVLALTGVIPEGLLP